MAIGDLLVGVTQVELLNYFLSFNKLLLFYSLIVLFCTVLICKRNETLFLLNKNTCNLILIVKKKKHSSANSNILIPNAFSKIIDFGIGSLHV